VIPDIAIAVRGLSKRYTRGPDVTWTAHQQVFELVRRPLVRLLGRSPSAGPDRSREAFWALSDVSFDVERGERLGIIGRNGAGKSTLLKILSRVVYPTSGEARIRGRVTSLLEVGTGFNVNLTGRENIYLNASIHGLQRKEIDARFDQIVEFAGIGPFLDTPVKRYSSGMHMRLAFSVAAHLDPDILLLDEVLAVGDLAFQQKCLTRVSGLASEGRTILFVSHSIEAISRLCTRAIWLDQGRIVAEGAVKDVVDAYVQTTMHVTASRTWAGASSTHAPASGHANGSVAAPGDDHVCLVSARVVDRSGQTIVSARVDEAVGIEITYDVLRDEELLLPALQLHSGSGVHLFNVAYTDPEYMFRIKAPGRWKSTAWIPPNLLNSGLIHVTVAIDTPHHKVTKHVLVERALAFHVNEVPEVEGTARGLYTRNFPGAVRPRLEWQTRPELNPVAQVG
jgi:lipopolysaccharide transport system ATP-binding protein